MFTNKTSDSRIGQPWSNEEDKQLLEEIGKKIDINEIASIHKRTVKGIKLRLVHNAIQAIEKGLFDVENAAEHFGISRIDIEEQKAKKAKETRMSTFKEKQPEYHEKYLELLTEIRDSLKILTQHLCSPLQHQQQQMPKQLKPLIDIPTQQESSSALPSPSSPLKSVVRVIKKPNLSPLKTNESSNSLPSLKGQQLDDHETLTIPFPKLKVEVQ